MTSGQTIIVNSNKALGSGAVGGATDLSLLVCSQPSPTGAIVSYGSGMLGLTVAQNQRIVFSINGAIMALTPGAYTVGMCGQSIDFADWNSKDAG